MDNVRQDLANFKLTGDRSTCLAITALLGGSNYLALHAAFEAVDIYRIKKSAISKTAPADMGKFNSQWKQWRQELKAKLKTAGGQQQQVEGRELGRRMMSLLKASDSFGWSSGGAHSGGATMTPFGPSLDGNGSSSASPAPLASVGAETPVAATVEAALVIPV